MRQIRSIFLGPKGVRSGWRLLLFLILLVGIALVLHLVIVRVAPAAHQAFEDLRRGKSTPLGLMVYEVPNLIGVFAALWIMARWEHRRLADYGLPAKGAFGKWFWLGVLWGAALPASMYGLLEAEGHFTFGKVLLSGTALLYAAVFWAVSNLMVGFSEELVFRGYAQKTLAESLGFWPAAVVLSIFFGLSHLGNTGYSLAGVGSAAMIGLAYCLSLKLLGSLWWAIGFHFACDYVELFIFAPGSGHVGSSVRLLSSRLSGPDWITGGAVGAEAGVNGYVLLIASILLFWCLFRARYNHKVNNAES